MTKLKIKNQMCVFIGTISIIIVSSLSTSSMAAFHHPVIPMVLISGCNPKPGVRPAQVICATAGALQTCHEVHLYHSWSEGGRPTESGPNALYSTFATVLGQHK